MVQHLNVPALKKQWVLDAQWTDCPLDVYDDVKRLWNHLGLGNDDYMARRSVNDLLEMTHDEAIVEEWDESINKWAEVSFKLDNLIAYLREKGIPDEEPVIIHWWW